MSQSKELLDAVLERLPNHNLEDHIDETLLIQIAGGGYSDIFIGSFTTETLSSAFRSPRCLACLKSKKDPLAVVCSQCRQLWDTKGRLAVKTLRLFVESGDHAKVSDVRA